MKEKSGGGGLEKKRREKRRTSFSLSLPPFCVSHSPPDKKHFSPIWENSAFFIFRNLCPVGLEVPHAFLSLVRGAIRVQTEEGGGKKRWKRFLQVTKWQQKGKRKEEQGVGESWHENVHISKKGKEEEVPLSDGGGLDMLVFRAISSLTLSLPKTQNIKTSFLLFASPFATHAWISRKAKMTIIIFPSPASSSFFPTHTHSAPLINKIWEIMGGIFFPFLLSLLPFSCEKWGKTMNTCALGASLSLLQERGGERGPSFLSLPPFLLPFLPTFLAEWIFLSTHDRPTPLLHFFRSRPHASCVESRSQSQTQTQNQPSSRIISGERREMRKLAVCAFCEKGSEDLRKIYCFAKFKLLVGKKRKKKKSGARKPKHEPHARSQTSIPLFDSHVCFPFPPKKKKKKKKKNRLSARKGKRKRRKRQTFIVCWEVEKRGLREFLLLSSFLSLPVPLTAATANFLATAASKVRSGRVAKRRKE